MADQYFHFTLGPVQAFVAQARRTRDFWSGSFLLSWLVSVAMQEVKAQGGDIQFPLPDDDYLKYLTGAEIGLANAPKQGSIPNRFKAMQAKVTADFEPQRVTDAVQQAWAALAELVWQGDLSFCGDKTRAVWERQVGGFWDMTWVLTENAGESNLLDRRKNWRSYMAPEEPGVSCMMMDGLQELSGSLRPGEELRQFWYELRFKSGGSGLKTDLRPGEYLCAVAYIKRRFARYFQELRLDFSWNAENYSHWCLHGWKVPVNVPSVNYLAAAPWLANSIIATQENPLLRADIVNFQYGIGQLESSREVRSFSLKRVASACEAAKWDKGDWPYLNGRYFYLDELTLLRDRAKKDDDYEEDVELLDNLIPRLASVQGKVGRPSDFYAILLMDGDSLGSQMSDASKQVGISTALNNFTRQVPAVVNEYSGFLVYAGGDDVLALLSVDDALACADALRQLYNRCFAEQNQTQNQTQKANGDLTITSSLSGALMFCHYKSPLAQNLAKAHPLLDDIAKEECGRDSLAVRVMKPGGEYCTWSTPWDLPANNSDELPFNRIAALNDLVASLMAEKVGDDRFSRKFFFKLEELVETLGLDKPESGLQADMIEPLFKAAWLHTGKKVKDLPPELPKQLLALTRVWRRTPEDNSSESKPQDQSKSNGFKVQPHNQSFDTGALKLLHFLSTELQSVPGSSVTDSSSAGKDAQ
jgi:CRISPR-associated protein Cmr2